MRVDMVPRSKKGKTKRRNVLMHVSVACSLTLGQKIRSHIMGPVGTRRRGFTHARLRNG